MMLIMMQSNALRSQLALLPPYIICMPVTCFCPRKVKLHGVKRQIVVIIVVFPCPVETLKCVSEWEREWMRIVCSAMRWYEGICMYIIFLFFYVYFMHSMYMHVCKYVLRGLLLYYEGNPVCIALSSVTTVTLAQSLTSFSAKCRHHTHT